MPRASFTFHSMAFHSGVITLAAFLAGCATQTAPSAGVYLPVTSAARHALESAGAVAPETASIWSVVSSPNDPPETTGIIDDVLYGVSSTSNKDVWAVGDNCCTAHGSQEYTNSLILHWNGSAWEIVNSASDEPADTQLHSVAAVSRNDAWAVGYAPQPSNECVIEHWTRGKWTVVPSPAISDCMLESVVALSANDVWAVGTGGFAALTEHWDGKAWSIVNSATGYGGVTILESVAAASPNDIWAVGTLDHPNSSVYAEHWNGTAWTQATFPKHFFQSLLESVTAVSSSDVWAVGYVEVSKTNRVPHTLIEHWNGSNWSQTKSPNMEPKGSYPLTNWLYGVTARSSKDVWAVGLWTWFTGDGTPRSLFEHWDGKQWKTVPGPSTLESNNNSDSNYPNAVTDVGGRSLWAVGSQTAALLHGYGCCSATLTVQTTHG